MHTCNKERELDLIHEDLTIIKSDVKSLLQFKWKIMGGAGLVGVICSLIINLFR